MTGKRSLAPWLLAVVSTIAMTFGFAWFDVPGHCSAFAGRDAALAAVFLDGHAAYLLGMLATIVLTAFLPEVLERRAPVVILCCAVVGTVANVLYCTDMSFNLMALSVAFMGFADVLLINVTAASSLAFVVDRRAQVPSLVCALAAKTALVYVVDVLLPDAGQVILFAAMPALAAIFAFLASCLVDDDARCVSLARLKFSPPLSTTVMGVLVVAGLIFAATRVVSSMGFWGSSYAVSDVGPFACAVATVVYVLACYFTLVRVDSRLLFRFLPALLLLFALYAVLYTGVGEVLGMRPSTVALISQYAELYGQAFVWTAILFAARTLRMPALRVMAVPFGLFVPVELLLQRYLLATGAGSLVVVLFAFFAAFAVLVWALVHFDGVVEERVPARCPACGPFAGEGASAQHVGPGSAMGVAMPGAVDPLPPAVSTAPPAEPSVAGIADGARRQMAVDAGLTKRETDVFLLLAQGRSRRFICDELFIADGTASTYIGRIYDKLGVRTKQELLTYVLEHEADRL